MKIGFEVEIEDCTNLSILVGSATLNSDNPTSTTIPLVEAVTDGSLRNGTEFVTKPLPDTAFANFLYNYMFTNIQGTYSERCGFHFHMDFTSHRKPEILDFVKRYLSVERALFATYPFLRTHNNFCNLLIDSTDELQVIRNYVASGRKGVFQDFSKYTALNLAPLYTQGTIEFRAVKAGLHPDQIALVFSIFNALYHDLPLPEPLATSPEDAAEAVATCQLLTTPVAPSSDLGEFMSQHFPTPPAPTLTRESILEYLRTI